MKKKFATVIQLLILSLAVSSSAALQGSNKKYEVMSWVDADFQTVFYGISKLAGADILLAPDVQGKISITLTKKTWTEMMTIICNLHNLTWLVEGNYISVQRTESYQRKIIEAAEKREQADVVAPLIRRSFHIKHASATEMASVLESIKSSRGRVSVVIRNNAIIVYDTEKRLEQMQSTLSELDVETLQIVITAKLVVVDSRLANELGVDWAARGAVGEGGRVSAIVSNRPSQAGITSSTGSGGAIAEGVISTTEITVNSFGRNMDATISNILSDSRSEILASPQISTLDHTEAQIFMGDQVSIRVMDNSGQSAQQMVESGIKLNVVPHVSGDNRILLELRTENNSYSLEQGQVIISKQEAQTKVVVADGETVVIGGLTKNDEIETETGIPLLKDIPVLGYLFKHTRKEISKKDLVIFVTPRVTHNYLSGSPVAMTAFKADAKTAEPDEDEDE
jgi:type IV pilus secretin PilQ/predicted competence protein